MDNSKYPTVKLFDAQCCHMYTAIKRPAPDRVKPSFVIFDIRPLSVRVAVMMGWWNWSNITNGGLTWFLVRCFIAVPIWQQWTSNLKKIANYIIKKPKSIIFIVARCNLPRASPLLARLTWTTSVWTPRSTAHHGLVAGLDAAQPCILSV